MQCACLASQANIETLRSRDVKREGGAAELLPVTLKSEQPQPAPMPAAAAAVGAEAEDSVAVAVWGLKANVLSAHNDLEKFAEQCFGVDLVNLKNTDTRTAVQASRQRATAPPLPLVLCRGSAGTTAPMSASLKKRTRFSPRAAAHCLQRVSVAVAAAIAVAVTAWSGSGAVGAGVPGNNVCAVFRAVTLHIASLKSAILEAVVSAMNDLAASQAGEVDVPKCWVDTPGDAILFPVASGTPEWSSVEQQFKSTLPTAQIVKLERVQNIDMWRAYSVQKKNMLKRVRRLGPPRLPPVCLCVFVGSAAGRGLGREGRSAAVPRHAERRAVGDLRWRVWLRSSLLCVRQCSWPLGMAVCRHQRHVGPGNLLRCECGVHFLGTNSELS